MQSGRFVILEHRTAQGVHWDFLLEWGEVLRAWALERPPEPGRKIAARSLPDHRKLYLDYEGPISRDRGSVRQWDRGTFTLVRSSELALVAELAGRQLAGQVTLTRESEETSCWLWACEA